MDRSDGNERLKTYDPGRKTQHRRRDARDTDDVGRKPFKGKGL